MTRFAFFLVTVFIRWIEASGQLPVVESKMYSWKQPERKVKGELYESMLFKGSAFDFEMLSMSANNLNRSLKPLKLLVPENEEHVLLVKDGTLALGIGDSLWLLGKGSVALLNPGEKFTVHNTLDNVVSFYCMKYRAKTGVDVSRNGGSFVKQWKRIAFRPHDRGGIRNYFERSTSMCRRFEMHVTTLKEGIKSHEPHTHKAEEIVLVIDNKTEMQIGDQFYKGGSGDIYFLGSNVSHAIRNDGMGTCTYFAFQFE